MLYIPSNCHSTNDKAVTLFSISLHVFLYFLFLALGVHRLRNDNLAASILAFLFSYPDSSRYGLWGVSHCTFPDVCSYVLWIFNLYSMCCGCRRRKEVLHKYGWICFSIKIWLFSGAFPEWHKRKKIELLSTRKNKKGLYFVRYRF